MQDYNRADPELLRQLDEAEGSDEPVAAAVSVRRKKGAPPDTAKIDKDLQAAMARAKDEAKAEPNHVRVMSHLAVAYIEGPGRLIRALLDQPEVTGAVAGRYNGQVLATNSPTKVERTREQGGGEAGKAKPKS
jgi:hypothetical protein